MTDLRTDLRLLARHRGDSPVAWESGRTTTAAELCAHVAGFRELLPVAAPDEEIVVICRDRYRFAVAILAAWQRGFSVALPPNPQPETMRIMRERPNVRTVVHDVDGGLGIDVRDTRVVSAARERVGLEPFAPLPALAPETKLATIYTSGSTGAHTACPKTAAQLLGEASVLVDAFSLPVGARILAMVPPHHIYGLLFGVLVPLASGGALYRHTPLMAPEVAGVAQGASVLVTVPAHLRALCLAADEQPKVARVFSSGAPLAPEVAVEARARFGWTITEVFGSSETGGIGFRESGGEGPWTPLPGVEVRAGEGGAIEVRSPFLHPDAPRPYVGADRVSVSDEGRFVHLGRTDGVLKIGGVRVSLAEIERRLLGIDGVRDAAVMAVSVPSGRGHELWAAVVAPSLDAAAIKQALREWLAPIAMPRRLRIVEALPREPNGKLPRRALEQLFEKRR